MILHVYDNFYIDLHINELHTMELIKTYTNHYYFSSNHFESYIPFNNDYGPINIHSILDFCLFVKNKITHPRLKNRKIVIIC